MKKFEKIVLEECRRSIEFNRERIENISDGASIELDAIESYLQEAINEIDDILKIN